MRMVEYVRLGDAATFINGRAFKPSEWDTEGLPIIRIQNLTQSTSEINYFTGEYQPRYEVNDGDVLISWSGSLGVYIWNGGKAVLNQHIFKVVFDKLDYDVSYFVYAVEQKITEMAKQTHGSTMKHIIKKDFDATLIPYPPLSEQQHIAKVLDTVGALIAKRKQQIALLDDAVKSLFVEMFGDPVENPMGWATLAFAEVFDISSSKRILKSEWKSEGIPFLRVRDMVQLATTGTLDNEFSVSEQFYASLQDSDGIPQKGDILVSATSTLGKCHIVADGERFYFKDADVLRFRPKKNINPVYFIELMDTEYIKRQIAQTLGITTVSHFTIVSAKKIHLRLPPIELQEEFAARVKKIETQRRQLERGLTKMEEAYGALMQEYFG